VHRPLVSPAGPLPRLFAWLTVGTLSRLSRRHIRALARLIGRLAWILGIRRRVALENLRYAFPELPEPERRRIARGAYENMALTALESLTATAQPEDALDGIVQWENRELFERSHAEGKGVLVATAHLGNWELLGSVLARQGLPLHAVVRPLRGAVNERIVRSRLQSGLRLIAARGAIRGMLRALSGGGVVCMLLDQVMPADKGVFVPFFGRPASTTPGLSVAARRTGAPVLVAASIREGDALRLHLEGPFPVPQTGDVEADIRAHTAEVTAAIERLIRRHPEQWLWLHRRWKVRPPPGN
jgi:Kdo2-lipid IVA lauroyltransferase/acyltransferase